MSGGFIPKEKLTAYQRWELAAFDEAERASERATEDAGQTGATLSSPEVSDAAARALPTAEEVERIHSEAASSGYAAGFEEGHAKGFAEGRAEGLAKGLEVGCAETKAETVRITGVLDHLHSQLQAMDQEIADQLLQLAVEIAGQVLRQSLRIKPELLLPVIREAIASLPLHHGHPVLFLNPSDAALVRQHLGEVLSHGSWKIIEDTTIASGGCRIESGASEIDATMQTRWKRVLEAIGAQADWLD